MHVLAVLGVVPECKVPSHELHRAELAGSVIVEHAVLIPEIVVAVLAALLSGHDNHDGPLYGSEDSSLTLNLGRSVPRLVELVASIDTPALEHGWTLGHVSSDLGWPYDRVG